MDEGTLIEQFGRPSRLDSDKLFVICCLEGFEAANDSFESKLISEVY